jgi:hypothetical protein
MFEYEVTIKKNCMKKSIVSIVTEKPVLESLFSKNIKATN